METRHPVEKALLDDLRKRTGLAFVKLGSINTNDKALAAAVLPVLQEWLSSISEPNIRAAIFHRFNTPHAAPFWRTLLEWWQNEEGEISLGWLTQGIVDIVDASNAREIWHQSRLGPKRPFHFMLWAKLARFASVGKEATDAVVEALEAGEVPVWELGYVAKMEDTRIKRWFLKRVDSEDKQVKQIARRVAAKGRKLPSQVKASLVSPDRSTAIFSSEVDLVDLRQALERAAKTFGLKVPIALKTASFLSSVDVDQWLTAPISGPNSESYELWLRLEDVDVVEFVVAPARVDLLPR